ncbi:hypothetical protein SMACR_03255 [Sordaria macrospora]|uniref:WGS project CABT00000000 data, contig 2.10 n=2 Tax=Sordaria macrospora TaxID=5147 RepID=F7VWC7_SORMK|nr:uncharacterized protein SMAC_03255 [Sordaria macrospora k-hell]KAA8635683.1 hypothetical protein SMACR_03255 [Sordaria macrospora]KAH7630109.1 hypothetical protein B0T09DRAFT_142447 [Sordaria sp. MPI-SDFR-AT-0083]WPJ66788.1 hypothetical protein SMAC4_03255 [Sordaria macrospora]CCC09695.1 unnamed protein product [Sordaria macrospora k-hell]
MATATKTVVATGASSGLGFYVIKHLLSQSSQPYNFILGARDVSRTQKAYRSAFASESLNPHSLEILPLELSDLRTVKRFASRTLDKLGDRKIDYLLLNAGITSGAGTEKPGPGGSKWCEGLVVNHLSQHYLTHLLLPALLRSDGGRNDTNTDTTGNPESRIVVVSSGAIRRVTDPSTLEKDLLAGSGKDGDTVYAETKFVQLLGAHWWRRKLRDTGCKVVAVSPGLIPGTGIGRGSGMVLSMEMKDAKSVDEGAQSILRAFTRDDFPEDSDRIFLTSWGEWWDSDTIGKSLDKELQDRWCLGKEEIEAGEGLKGL